MCLLIDKKVRNNHHKEDGYCVGYKVLRDNNNSPYRGRSYSIGWQEAFLKEEENLQEVRYGLHLFLNKKEAMMELKDWGIIWGSSNYKIIKVYYRIEDVIAYGTFDIMRTRGITKSVAVKKLLVKSLKDIR